MTTSTTRRQPPPPAPDYVDREDVSGDARTSPPTPDPISPAAPVGRDGGAPSAAEDAAQCLLGALAAAAVRRDAAVLADPLAEATPWSRVLPPAAWRVYAAEMGQAVRRDGAERVPAMVETMRRWELVANRFA